MTPRRLDAPQDRTLRSHFHAVGVHYDYFHQVADDEVIRILAQARPGSASVPVR